MDDKEAMMNGVVEMTKGMLSFVESMGLKCAVELRIPDIIHSHGRPITLSEIASGIDSPRPIDIAQLKRVMRLLVHLNVFTATQQGDDSTLYYGLTPSSIALLHDAEGSLAPLVLLHNHPMLQPAWHHLSDCVCQGGTSGFKRVHGVEFFEMTSTNPEINNLFNDAMRCSAHVLIKAIVTTYREGLDSIGSLVDVGGGVGILAAEIVKAFPHIKGFNFDLPHVVATAPDYGGVISHVAGDMFVHVPPADAVFLMHILHAWTDEDCVKILNNCRKAILEKKGKVVIVDIVVSDEGKEVIDNIDVVMNLLMMVNSPSGKERSENEWKKILQQGGFSTYKITQLPLHRSIIEAYPW